MLEKLKEEVCETNRSLGQSGLVALTWGNVSGIDRNSGLVVIKPSGVDYADLSPDSCVVVDLAGEVIEGDLQPSSDTPTHLALYDAFKDIGGIAHTHSTYATMFAQSCRGIPCLGTTHADIFYGEIPVTRPMTKSEVQNDYELNTGSVIVERFSRLDPMEIPGVLVSNHGPFAWGKTALDALKTSIALEQVAKMAIGTFTISGNQDAIPQYLLDKHFLRKHGSNAYYGQADKS